MTDQDKIPKHWEIKKLGEVLDIQGGSQPAKSNFIYEPKDGYIQLLQIRDFGEKGHPTFVPKKLVTKFCKRDDILIARYGASLGRIVTGHEGAYNVALAKVIDENCVFEKRFIFYLLKTQIFQTPLAMLSRSAQNGFSKGEIAGIELPLPPLHEQQAIVAKIEELLSDLENGKQQLQTAQQQLKVYRQSLLKWAFEGKLTNKNVKEGELPVGWKWVKSGELFSFVTSGSRGWAKYYSNSGSIFIRITNMDFDTLDLNLKSEKIQYVNPPSNSEGIRTKVQEGDFLFSITGYLGMFAIAPKLENAYVNQHVCLCRPKEGFNKKYVGYWIVSKSGGHHYLNKNQKGAVKAGLNLDDLKGFPVPIASIEEQNQIVLELESKLTVCDKIAETISQSLQQAETLRQSILKKAFEGKLV